MNRALIVSNCLANMKNMIVFLCIVALYSFQAVADTRSCCTSDDDSLSLDAQEVMEAYRLHDPVDLLNYKLGSGKQEPHKEGSERSVVDWQLGEESGEQVGGGCNNRAMGEEARRAQSFRRSDVEGTSRLKTPSTKLHFSIPLQGQSTNKD